MSPRDPITVSAADVAAVLSLDCHRPTGPCRCEDCEARLRLSRAIDMPAKEVYDNLPPDALNAAESFIRGLLYNADEQPLDELNAAKNLATHVLWAAGWRP